MLKHLRGMKRDTCRQNSQKILAKFLPASLLGVCCNQSTVHWKRVARTFVTSMHYKSVTKMFSDGRTQKIQHRLHKGPPLDIGPISVQITYSQSGFLRLLILYFLLSFSSSIFCTKILICLIQSITVSFI
jgi:hypothetical protein